MQISRKDGEGKEIVMTFDREIKMELDEEDMEWVEEVQIWGKELGLKKKRLH